MHTTTPRMGGFSQHLWLVSQALTPPHDRPSIRHAASPVAD
jgi:hypothetical protein